eukprot:CCRYP_012964-RA/>CCRYP_012964-RA protein AED:0.29 eAED:0.29 QI:0/-1/0/1/-1/1/1/0/528
MTLVSKIEFFKYDNDSGSILPILEEVDDSSTDDSFFSAGNANSFPNHECFELEFKEPRYNYHWPMIIVPRRECPVTICTADTIGAVKSRRLLRVLLDSNLTVSIIKRSVLPPKVVTKTISETKNISILAGKLQAQEVVTLRDLRLPEFDKNQCISQQKASVFDNDNVRYDIILGTNILSKTGIRLKYSEGKMELFDCSLRLWPPGVLDSKDFDAMDDMFFIQAEEELFGKDWFSCYATDILDAKYEWKDVAEVVDKQTHLNAHQKKDLLQVLQDNRKMFDGALGLYPHHKVHIELVHTAKPVHAQPYSVPRVHMSTFNQELDHLVQLGVLLPGQESEWASLTFIILKKDGRVRWISDLHQLNKVIKQRQYPLPTISDFLCEYSGYRFCTKLDVSMQYYTFELDEESQDLCMIITPFSKYMYAWLPMGLKCSPDIARSIMESVLSGIEDADVYIDDIGAFSQDWDHHIKLLSMILRRLRENGFTINPLKCEWAVQETDWLSYWLTPQGLKPWKKKIEAILHMACHCNAT